MYSLFEIVKRFCHNSSHIFRNWLILSKSTLFCIVRDLFRSERNLFDDASDRKVLLNEWLFFNDNLLTLFFRSSFARMLHFQA